VPLVLFRGEGGEPAALLDRCAHRNVPLSLGRLRGARLECAYHGWRYDAGGACREVPGLSAERAPKARVPSYPALERDGLVWVHGTPDARPPADPFRLPALGRGYTTLRRAVDMEASLHAVLENALDVPHTAFLHGGLFRGGRGEAREITVVVTRIADGVQAEYVGEPRPKGLAARLLAPAGGVVTHHDRFLLPSIAQVEYRVGADTHFLVTTLCTPVEALRTRLHAVVSFRLRVPGWLVAPLLAPLAWRIVRQDAAILKQQSEAVRRFGGERYVSTEIDVLGGHIARLLRRVEAGLPPDPDESAFRREIRLRV
jgi:phenylpropionate dioxygenase-like ring-hydroxylating dioxygenase large terminal subunit